MATAKQLPSGLYRVIVYVGKDENGKKKYKSFTDKDKRRCEKIASVYADEHRVVNDSSTLEGAVSDFLDIRKAVLSPSTYRGYASVDRYFKTHYKSFYERSVYDITADNLQTVVNDMVENGQSPKSISNKLGLISAVLTYKDMRMPGIKMPERERPDFNIPDAKDVEKILKKAKGKDIEVPILLAAYGGMRRSEICALTLDDITGDTIHITKAIVPNEKNKSVQKSPKTYDSKRDVPMSHEIIEKILKKGYVTDVENPEIISQRFRRVTKDAGYEDMRFHDLRHFHASYLHAKGIPDQYIMARCGWKTDTVMKRIYRHTLQSEEEKKNQEIVNIFSDMINGQHERQHES